MVGVIRLSKRTLSTFLSTIQKASVFIRSMDVFEVIKDTNLLYKVLDDMVEDVRDENVVQVVTDNEYNYVKVGIKILRIHCLPTFLIYLNIF